MNVRVCFKCGVYTPIHPENSVNNNILQQFEFLHFKHPVQTLARKEIPKSFKAVMLMGAGRIYDEL